MFLKHLCCHSDILDILRILPLLVILTVSKNHFYVSYFGFIFRLLHICDIAILNFGLQCLFLVETVMEIVSLFVSFAKIAKFGTITDVKIF